ncbi:MAG: hypothetical protein ACJAVM_003175 [Sulfitobacter sp.]
MAAALAFAGVVPPALSQTRGAALEFDSITFTSADTIRDFVGQHLGDPDLWPYVLELNQITNPADLRPNDSLKMPVKQVRAADEALKIALDTIQIATAEGAQVFAPVQIGNAVANRETALERREAFEWGDVVDLSNIATLLAQEALEIAIAQRDRSAEAIVSDVQGDVQGRAPAEPRWSGRDMNAILVEFERVRTLSGSTTQITFRDLSRLRLNANSNATIQRMRSDPLTGDEVTKVSLVDGDFYAVLNQLSDKTAFEIDVPGVETTTKSSDFWVKNDKSGARFVNYDQASLKVKRGDTAVTIGENEGVVIDGNGAKTADVLNSPRLTLPADQTIVYSAAATLAWDGFDGAAGYWLEVARDAGFNEMQVSEWGIADTGFTTPELPPAHYFWRVAALDQLGLPGQWSKPAGFIMRRDNTPPFLTLLAPADDALSEAQTVIAFGASEPEAIVLLNGSALTLNSDGSFERDLTLHEGVNVITLEATDPAGNQSSLSQTVIYRPATTVEIAFDPAIPRIGDVLATRSEELALRAQTTALADAPVTVVNATGAVVVQTVVGPRGGVSFSVPVTLQEQGYRIEVFAPNGKSEGGADFFAIRDETPPQITLDLPLPKATDHPDLIIEGDAGDAMSLTLDGQAVVLAEGRFRITTTLQTDVNDFDLRAADAVGNVTALRLQTVYDIDPPLITRAEATRPQGAAGPITIEVAASDPSGLRKSATYLIDIGGVEQDGFLRCDSATGMCRASLPPETGPIQLIEVAVEDYAGNTAFK